MATPTYQGAGQPIVESGGWLGSLGTFFGGGTPAYAGNGQPSAGAGVLGGAPVYASAPVTVPAAAAPVAAAVCEDAPRVMAMAIDPEALAAGQIAIVFPRP